MENNNKIRELYSIYLELGHKVFEEKIKKHMELCLCANNNIISMNSLNSIIANAMEKSKLGEAGVDEHDIFSPPSMEEKIYFDDTMPPIYDDYNDEYDIFSPPTIEEKIRYDYNMPPIFDDYDDENNIDSYIVEFAPTTIHKNDYAYVGSINSFMHVAHDKNVLCDSYIVNFIHDATESYYERGKDGFMHLNNIKGDFFSGSGPVSKSQTSEAQKKSPVLAQLIFTMKPISCLYRETALDRILDSFLSFLVRNRIGIEVYPLFAFYSQQNAMLEDNVWDKPK
jgi:hypothetical protein